jgi:CCR4-NOT transcription complex subunit 2
MSASQAPSASSAPSSQGWLLDHDGMKSQLGNYMTAVTSGSVPPSSSLQQQQQQQQQARASSDESYSLSHLVSLVQSPNPDVGILSLGVDINHLGLDLALSEPSLHKSFANPIGESPVSKEPNYVLPASYRITQPALKTGHLARFEVSTLMYIFYAMPKDALQMFAAAELYSRDWRYHHELRAWFHKEQQASAGPSDNRNSPFSYFLWDIQTWTKVPFNGNAVSLQAGFLSEEEIDGVLRNQQSGGIQQQQPL